MPCAMPACCCAALFMVGAFTAVSIPTVPVLDAAFHGCVFIVPAISKPLCHVAAYSGEYLRWRVDAEDAFHTVHDSAEKAGNLIFEP